MTFTVHLIILQYILNFIVLIMLFSLWWQRALKSSFKIIIILLLRLSRLATPLYTFGNMSVWASTCLQPENAYEIFHDIEIYVFELIKSRVFTWPFHDPGDRWECVDCGLHTFPWYFIKCQQVTNMVLVLVQHNITFNNILHVNRMDLAI